MAKPRAVRTRPRFSPAVLVGAVLLPPALIGCGTRTEMFNVRVRNATTQPVTICLTKEAERGHYPGPDEEDWKPPEDAASESAVEREPRGQTVVPAGREAFVHHLKGTFDAYTHPVLRCYWGDMTISQMAARGPGSPDRVDVPLTPGRNELTIVDKAARITAEVEQNAPRDKSK